MNLRNILWYGAYDGNIAREQVERFDWHSGLDPCDDAFHDNPRTHWCETGADAYLLIRELEANGLPVSLLWDMSDADNGWGCKWVVLTRRSTDE